MMAAGTETLGRREGHRQAGFTLVEMMIALVLGLMVVLGASQLYLIALRSSESIADVARRKEVVSYVANVVGNEVRASSTLYPVSAGSPSATSGNLQINYADASADPPFSDFYCPAGEALEALEYFAEDDAGSGKGYLAVAPFCSVSGKVDPQRVIAGVESLSAARGSGDRFADLTLTLTSADSIFDIAAAEKHTFTLRLASHSAAIFD